MIQAVLPHVQTHPVLLAAHSSGLQHNSRTGGTATPQQRHVIGVQLCSVAQAVSMFAVPSHPRQTGHTMVTGDCETAVAQVWAFRAPAPIG